MPRVLALFTDKALAVYIKELESRELDSQNRYTKKEQHLSRVYHILLRWNTAELFGFPSQEKLRIGARVVELEAKNAELETLVAKMEEENAEGNTVLKADNARMRDENAKLKRKIEQISKVIANCEE